MAKPRAAARVCVVKTYRFDPKLIEDVNRVVFLTQEGDEPKYGSSTSFVVTALKRLIRKEKKELEDAGVVWGALAPNYTKTKQQEEVV